MSTGRSLALSAAGGLALLLLGRSALRRSRRISLGGKVVLVTGGSRGLGFAAARRFIEQGAQVAICARNAAELQRAVALLQQGVTRAGGTRGGNPRVLAICADVTDAESARRAVSETLAMFG